MNLMPEEANELFSNLNESKTWPSDVEMMIFPPAIYLQGFASKKNENLILGSQNFFQKEKGAYTGEISISQIKATGATAVLVGHSERRAYFGEHESFLKEKVDAAIEHQLHVVFCCGEPLEVRKSGDEKDFVKKQLEESLFHLEEDQIIKTTIAYEPVWAIGTGLTANEEEAEDMHAAIRSWLIERYSLETANEISILYGGSCNAENAKGLFACPNVDGGLIGGASLKKDDFHTIANSF